MTTVLGGRVAVQSAVAGAAMLVALVAAQAATASHPQPTPDITKMDYTPIGFYKPEDPIPSPLAPPADNNPSGKYVAYDTNVFETLNFPSRHPGDESANDPPGSGDERHGFCPPTNRDPLGEEPTFVPWGLCANHQLEWLDYYERTMKEILGEFGVVVHRYEFESPGASIEGHSRGDYLDAAGGRAINISATVPGADHPDETVLVSGHYDFTDSGPAAAWDSAEGHAMVIRIAKIMADYWRATGTRPSATVKFIPWDSEESGTFGSIDYVENNIPPGEEDKVRGYFNMDPCAGAYPAFRNGNPASRVPEVMQLADPASFEDNKPVHDRIVAFNARAETVVDEVFDHLDDTITTGGQRFPIFVANDEATPLQPSQRGEVVTALGGLLLFSSDYANFEAVGIPIFNLFPDYFGPHADGTPASSEGIGILHTPRDNLTTINALTSADQTGLSASEGWAKGMEMCAHVEGWYMLQPEMGGSQTATGDVVAYFEALPNEAVRRQDAVRFDASGTYQYASVVTRALMKEAHLVYEWEFGDGTKGVGKIAEHRYEEVGRYLARLTVRSPSTGLSDTMTIPITVVDTNMPPPTLAPLSASDADGRFRLSWTYAGTRENLKRYSIEQSTNLQRLIDDPAETVQPGSAESRWNRNVPLDPRLQPWQLSKDSLAANGNNHHSGESGYWTGAVPFAPSPVLVQSILTLKQPVTVPASGEAQLVYWSLMQSESDDEGRVEVAIEDGDPTTNPIWQTVDVVSDTWVPTDGEPAEQPLEERRISLNRFRGRNVLVRFRYSLGAFDRPLSHPAGWYIDDISFLAGSWAEIATVPENQTTYDVYAKKPGTYSYRVRAVFQGGVGTQPSTPQSILVTG